MPSATVKGGGARSARSGGSEAHADDQRNGYGRRAPKEQACADQAHPVAPPAGTTVAVALSEVGAAQGEPGRDS